MWLDYGISRHGEGRVRGTCRPSGGCRRRCQEEDSACQELDSRRRFWTRHHSWCRQAGYHASRANSRAWSPDSRPIVVVSFNYSWTREGYCFELGGELFIFHLFCLHPFLSIFSVFVFRAYLILIYFIFCQHIKAIITSEEVSAFLFVSLCVYMGNVESCWIEFNGTSSSCFSRGPLLWMGLGR